MSNPQYAERKRGAAGDDKQGPSTWSRGEPSVYRRWLEHDAQWPERPALLFPHLRVRTEASVTTADNLAQLVRKAVTGSNRNAHEPVRRVGLGDYLRESIVQVSAWTAVRGVLHQRLSDLIAALRLEADATLGALFDRLTERPEPTELEFERLAADNPRLLAQWIEDGTLSPAQMTYAAEALGSAPTSVAAPCLLRLLAHSSSLVREGAVYGLEPHLKYPGVRTRLQELVREDPREGVRAAAAEALG
jgi:hypothetical protein